MTRTRTFTAIYQQDGEWIVAWAAELRGEYTGAHPGRSTRKSG